LGWRKRIGFYGQAQTIAQFKSQLLDIAAWVSQTGHLLVPYVIQQIKVLDFSVFPVSEHAFV
jgi:hypothetical protein